MTTPGNPTPLEEAAINLHDFLWENAGDTEDWPVHLSGDGIDELIRLLNKLQNEIKAAGFYTRTS
jgi:hypothetical protein